MPRLIVWHCDDCDKESRSESMGWLVVKEFSNSRPRFLSFCCWNCLYHWLSNRQTAKKVSMR